MTDPTAEPLLRTKVLPPPLRAALVARDRLRMRMGLDQPQSVSLVTAPAGAGKTTLVAQILALPDNPPAAWFALDPRDNDPARFWRYLAAALGQVDPRLYAAAGPWLDAAAAGEADAYLAALLSTLALRDAPLVLVLDDYHLLTVPAIHAAIGELLEFAPAQLRLVLISRERPPLPLDRLRVRGRLFEVQANDLRFTAEEAGRLLAGFLHPTPPPAAVESLVAQTEGWGAGLILAAISARDHALPAEGATPLNAATPLLAEYIAGEIVSRQPPAIRAFLLRSAILDRLSAPLCAALLDPPADADAGRRLLEHVEQRGLFLIPLDAERRWFRYHHLFGEVLRTQLERDDPSLARELRRRAAAWLAEQHLLDEAIDYALAAEAWALAGELIGNLGRAMLVRGELVTLRNRLAALPPEVRSQPRLAFLDGWLYVLAGDLAAAAAIADRAGPSGEPADEQRTMRAIITVLHGRVPDPAERAALAGEARSEVPFLRAIAIFGHGLQTQLEGDAQAAEAAYRQAIQTAQAAGNLLIAFIALLQLGEVLLLRGRLRAAEQTFRQALDLAARTGSSAAQLQLVANVGLGIVASERGDYQLAERVIGSGLTNRTLLGDTAGLEALLALIETALARADRTAAATYLEHAAALATQPHVTLFRCSVEALRAEYDLLCGDQAAALAWLNTPYLSAGLGLIDEVVQLGRVRVLLGLGRYSEALAKLDQLAPQAEAGGRGRSVLAALVLRARALHGLGRLAEAAQVAAAARELGEPEGFRRVLAGLPPDSDAPLTQPDDALTIRELEVLRLIAAGLDNATIAAHLVVAPSTVKKHINRIFSKLDAASRTQALVRARERGILDRG